MKILVVDDTPVNQESARETLENHDLTVVGSYDEAIEALNTNSYEAVLLDLLMPASRKTMGDKGIKYAGRLMPVGLSLLMVTCRKGGWRQLTPPKWILMATATNHHDHSASAWLDNLGGFFPPSEGMFQINGATCAFFKAYHTSFTPSGGKDWGKMLGQVMGEVPLGWCKD